MTSFIRIGNELVEDMPEPEFKDYLLFKHPHATHQIEYEKWKKRPRYPINPSDYDKFKEGEMYEEGKEFEVKEVMEKLSDEQYHSKQNQNRDNPTIGYLAKRAFAIHKDNDMSKDFYCESQMDGGKRCETVCDLCRPYPTPSPIQNKPEESDKTNEREVLDLSMKLVRYGWDAAAEKILDYCFHNKVTPEFSDMIMAMLDENNKNKFVWENFEKQLNQSASQSAPDNQEQDYKAEIELHKKHNVILHEKLQEALNQNARDTIEIDRLNNAIEQIYIPICDGQKQEIERLKGLIEKAHTIG